VLKTDWSLFIWVVIYERRGIILGPVRGFVSGESKTTPNPMANYVATLWEDVSVLDARFLNLVSWGWFVRVGVFFSGGERGSCTQGDMSKICFTLLPFFTSPIRTYLWLESSVGLHRMGIKLWWRKQTVKISELLFFSVSLRFGNKNNEEGRCTLYEYSAEHGVSVGQCVWLSLFTRPVKNLGPDITCSECFMRFSV